MDRRHFLQAGALGAALVAAGCSVPPGPADVADGPARYGALRNPDRLGLQLPQGFSARIVARSSNLVEGTDHIWHLAPDGGACFAAPNGGWVYVSNSEVPFFLGGGVGALSFGRDGRVVSAYRILTGSSLNCGGGPTPWGTWLSCEEFFAGQVFQSDPLRPGQGYPLPALGRFAHEAVAVDPVHQCLYLTEDDPQGRLYRFRPDRYPALDRGVLEAAAVDGDGTGGGRVAWVRVDPEAIQVLARIDGTTVFTGGEGCWYDDGTVWFTTKGDNRVWALDCASQQLRVVFSPAADAAGTLRGVDNVTVSPRGDVVVAEDGGNMELVMLGPDGVPTPFLRLVGQDGSEITGPAFSPDGTRLYFSSQRGPSSNRLGFDGITYEVSGPF
jgi:secreted PhoX family phosphatase